MPQPLTEAPHPFCRAPYGCNQPYCKAEGCQSAHPHPVPAVAAAEQPEALTAHEPATTEPKWRKDWMDSDEYKARPQYK